MPTLAEFFAASESGRIQWDGHELVRDLVVEVADGDEIFIHFLRSCVTPVQGVGINTHLCQIEVAGTRAAHIGLWRDTAPAEVALRVVAARRGATITLFNQWRDEKHGTTLYHLNNAAMEIGQEPHDSFLVRCSDGWGPVDFGDLEFRVALKSNTSD